MDLRGEDPGLHPESLGRHWEILDRRVRLAFHGDASEDVKKWITTKVLVTRNSS